MNFHERTELPEPLDSHTWSSRIESLASEIASSSAENGSLERLLRQMFHLQLLAPEPMRNFAQTNVAEDTFETILAAEHFSVAAQILINDVFSLSIANNSGKFQASLVLSQFGLAAEGLADQRAQAILQALAGAMLQMRTLATQH